MEQKEHCRGRGPQGGWAVWQHEVRRAVNEEDKDSEEGVPKSWGPEARAKSLGGRGQEDLREVRRVASIS